MKTQELEEIDKIIGKRLRTKRLVKGMSQQELAGLTGITFQQIQKYESGKNRISGSRIYQFCKILDDRPDYFFRDLFTEQDDTDDSFDVLSNYESLKELSAMIKIYQNIKSDATRIALRRFMQALSSEEND